MKIIYKLGLLFSLLLCANSVYTQQTDENNGIEFYKIGNYQNAVINLKKSVDIKDLYYLGLAYEKLGETGNAKDAYRKSFAKSYDNFFGKFDEWQKIEYSETKKSFSDLLQEVKLNNEIGYASAEKAYSLKSDIFQTNEWRIKAKVLFDAAKLAATGEKIYSSVDKSIKELRIKEKPRAVFPKDSSGTPIASADFHPNLGNTTTLFIVLGADGQIKLLMPAEEKVNSFTASSINAAGNVKFEPATKDKKAITVYSKIQYSFRIGN